MYHIDSSSTMYSSGSPRNISEGSNTQALMTQMQGAGISPSDCNVIVQTAREILVRCVSPSTNGSERGLIYGNIQSGKTAVIIAVMTLGLDNGYRNFIVLTSDLNDLYEQTLSRIQSTLHTCNILGKQDFRDPQSIGNHIPLVFVSSKNSRVLPRLTSAISQLSRSSEGFLIIDDEADQASLDTKINTSQPISGVNREIINLRSSLDSHSYLQTTATPQALFLQDRDNQFNPNFVVVTSPGSSYCGGELFFGNDDFLTSPHLRIVNPIDLFRLRNDNFLPSSLTRSLYVFFLGASILRLQGSHKSYAYLLHTSFRQADHTQVAISISRFFTELQNELVNVSSNLTTSRMQSLSEAYDDLQGTFSPGIPPLIDVITEMRTYITSTNIVEVNSSTGQGVDPNPSRRHILYIGGTKIGRGVTIKNLLVTYYGRNSQRPQMDTVLQHARMYGYRRDELPSIRIYLPIYLAQRFHDIHSSNQIAREACRQTFEPISVFPLARSLNPARRNVLNQNTVNQRAFIGGSQYFPKQPSSPLSTIRSQTSQLDQILGLQRFPNEQHSYEVSIDEILDVLNFEFATPDGSNGAWNDELIRHAVREIRDDSSFPNIANLVIVNRDADIGRSAETGVVGAIIPGGAGNAPYGVHRDQLALMMTRIVGQPSKNWYGEPLWIPTIRFPDGNYAFAANYSL